MGLRSSRGQTVRFGHSSPKHNGWTAGTASAFANCGNAAAALSFVEPALTSTVGAPLRKCKQTQFFEFDTYPLRSRHPARSRRRDEPSSFLPMAQ